MEYLWTYSSAMLLSRQNLQVLILFFLWWLIFWNGSWEFRPGMDAMTYGSLAKHILTTGEWTRLHYSQQAYADFFQPPPLAIWLTAVFFKFFGASDIVSKILPNFFSFFCLLGVVIWGCRWKNTWFGFVAGFVLLTSVRFTKYSVGFMLDPFLAAFMLWAVLWGLIAIDLWPPGPITPKEEKLPRIPGQTMIEIKNYVFTQCLPLFSPVSALLEHS